MNPQKKEDIEIAARAEFEAMKAAIEELDALDWDRLPEADSHPPTPRCKQFYRGSVGTAVEALWRAHRLQPEVISIDPMRFGFVDLVSIARQLLDVHYPADVFVGGPSTTDSGVRFVAQLRSALKEVHA